MKGRLRLLNGANLPEPDQMPAYGAFRDPFGLSDSAATGHLIVIVRIVPGDIRPASCV